MGFYIVQKAKKSTAILLHRIYSIENSERRFGGEFISLERPILHKKWSFPLDLVTFTEEILNGKLHFLCSVSLSIHCEICIFWQGCLFCKLLPDIDECATNTDQCSINAICTNLIGGYSCRCKDFYTGNGFVCNGKYKTVDKCFHKSEQKFILQDIFWIDLNFDFVILIDTLNWLTA